MFYFYPSDVEEDLVQSGFVKDIPNVYPFILKSNVHGKTVYDRNIPILLAMSAEELVRLCGQYRGRVIHPAVFSLKTAGPGSTASSAAYAALKRGAALLRSQKRH